MAGNFLIIILFFANCLIWLLAKAPFVNINLNNLFFSQFMAITALFLMSISLILSTKSRFIENIFNGLDKLYKTHRFVGSLSFVLMLNHPILLIINSLPNRQIASLYAYLGPDNGINLGIVSLYLSIFSIFFMVFTKLPYQLWLLSHKIMGVSFIFAGIHGILSGTDINNYFPLKLWIVFLFLAGSIAFVYTEFLYKKFGPKFEYTISDIQKTIGAITLKLTPTNRKLNFTPGQFVYTSVLSKTVKKELHPFSISSAPRDNFLEISAKIVGDYTLSLHNVSVGGKVIVYGPYGRFAHTFYKDKQTNNPTVWIAGGIGITPFISMMKDYVAQKRDDRIYFFYTYRGIENAYFEHTIIGNLTNTPNVSYFSWDSSKLGRLTSEIILQKDNNLKNSNFLLCGPDTMMEDLKNQLVKSGITENKIIYEDFKFID